MKRIGFLVLAVSMLFGCATFNKIVTNEALVSQLAVEAATARVIHEHPDWQKEAVRITGNAIAAIDSKVTADLDSLTGYVEESVKWEKLLPEEQAIVSVLIGQVKQNLEDSFRGQNIGNPAAQLVQVKQVLEWIRDAAKRQV